MIYDRPTMICENLSPDDNIHPKPFRSPGAEHPRYGSINYPGAMMAAPA